MMAPSATTCPSRSARVRSIGSKTDRGRATHPPDRLFVGRSRSAPRWEAGSVPANRGIRPTGDSSGKHARFYERVPFATMGELGRSSQYTARWMTKCWKAYALACRMLCGVGSPHRGVSHASHKEHPSSAARQPRDARLISIASKRSLVSPAQGPFNRGLRVTASHSSSCSGPPVSIGSSGVMTRVAEGGDG